MIIDAIFNTAAFAAAFLYANMGEWAFHRFVLHGLGKKRESFFSYHWFEHHRVCWESHMLDPGYQRFPTHWNAQAKELLVLAVIVFLHGPFFLAIPGFAAGFYLAIGCYYYRHRRAHLDPAWGLKYLPWHYDHHLNREEADANWCITWPWFDHVMGTRVKGG